MKPVTVRLRKRRGRNYEYKEINVPSESDMERIAAELHEKRVPTLLDILGWSVRYLPALVVNYSATEVDPFTKEHGETSHHEAKTVPHCVFGYGSEEWRVCFTWNNGNEQPPTRIQERGDVVPALPHKQGELF